MELFEYLTIHNRSKTHKNIANKLLNMNISTKELTVRYQEAEQHKHLMRQANFTFEGFFTKSKTKKDYTKAMEKYDDAVYDAIMKNKSKKLLHSIISNKYSHLVDENTERIFEVFVEEDIDRETIQNGLTKKIARINDNYEFNQELNILADNLISWDKQSVLDKIKKGRDIEFTEFENRLVVKAHDFKTAKLLGSRMWCITQSDEYFKNYTQGLEQFYFDFDFNKSPTDTSSLRAFIVNRNKECIDGYSRNDTAYPIHENKEFELKNNDLFTPISNENVKKIIDKTIEEKPLKPFTFGLFKDQSTNFLNKISQKAELISALTPEESEYFYESLYEKRKSDPCKSDINIFANSNLRGFMRDSKISIDAKMDLVFNNKYLDKHLEDNQSSLSKKEKISDFLSMSDFEKIHIPMIKYIIDHDVISIDELTTFRNNTHKIINNEGLDIILLSKGADIETDIHGYNQYVLDLFELFNKDEQKKFFDVIEDQSHYMKTDSVKSNILSNRYNRDVKYTNNFTGLNEFLESHPDMLTVSSVEMFVAYAFSDTYNREIPLYLNEMLHSKNEIIQGAGKKLLKSKDRFLHTDFDYCKESGFTQFDEFNDMLKTINPNDIVNHFDLSDKTSLDIFENIVKLKGEEFREELKDAECIIIPIEMSKDNWVNQIEDIKNRTETILTSKVSQDKKEVLKKRFKHS